MQEGRLRTAAHQALGRRVAGPVDEVGYLRSLRDNLVSRVGDDALREAVSGAGREKRKMHAPWSSAALALNVFGPWRDHPSTLPLMDGAGFEEVQLERPCPSGLRGTPPHLDVLARRSGEVVAVESKCTEILSPTKAHFSNAYDGIGDRRSESAWFRQIAHVRADPAAYRLLDVAQLVKHYLGLTHTFPSQQVTLLYLYWEPLDWTEYEPYRRHRLEIDLFGNAVDGDPFVAFHSTSYDLLWSAWQGHQKSPPWLDDHLGELRARYSVGVGPSLGD